jgi:hypothetical protein
MPDFLTSLSPYLLILTEEQAAFLRKYGPALESLATGRTRPRTPLQERFCAVVSGRAAPRAPEEQLWLRLTKVRQRVQTLSIRYHENFELSRRIAQLEAELSESHLAVGVAAKEGELASRTITELKRELQAQTLDCRHQTERLSRELAECRRRSIAKGVSHEKKQAGGPTIGTKRISGVRAPRAPESACGYCGGDGGAGGRCPRCEGSGLG